MAEGKSSHRSAANELTFFFFFFYEGFFFPGMDMAALFHKGGRPLKKPLSSYEQPHFDANVRAVECSATHPIDFSCAPSYV